MAILSFKVQADIQKVIDLRNEIARLEAVMKQIKGKMPSADVSELEQKLASAKTELNSMTTEAAKAGATFGVGLKKKIMESSEVVNTFSERIVAQKAKVWELNESVKKLNKSYRESLKKGDNTESDKILKQLESNKIALDNAKAALNKLNKEKAMAQIKTKRLRDEYSLLKQDTKGVASETDNLADSFAKWAKGIIGVKALKEFVGQIVRVRGEFQEMETAISTLVGDDMANKLLPQIKELAKVSPLTMTDIVGAEKMMLGFNIEADKTIRYLQALSDVSMGNSQKFNSLTLAFSQMSAAGKLMGQDLNQMINAGFNPLQVISEKTGKSIAQLKDEVSKGAVSAEMVQQAFIDATSEGGKFFNMSQNASKTINGQISMLEDAVDTMFNELGKASEGVILKAIQSATGLVENYEKVGAILLSLVATYGAYRAALIAAVAIEKIKYISTIGLTTAEKAHYAWLVLVEKAQKVLNRTMLSNPYVLATMAVIGLVAGMIKLLNANSGVETSLGRVNRQIDEHKSKQEELRQSVEKYLAVIQDEATTMKQKQDAYNKLIEVFPQLTGKYDLQTLSAMKLTDATKAVNKELTNQDILLNKQQIRESKANLQKLYREKQWFDKSGNKDSSARVAAEIAEEEKVLQGLLKTQAEYRKANEEEQKKEETQNKKYWEKKKEEAEAKLEALDISKKGSEEWIQYQKEIQQAQAKVDEYSTSKVDKKQVEDNKEDAKRAANLLKIEEYKKSVIDANAQAQFEIRQAEINAMEDGTEKVIAQINLDYDKQIAENKKRKEDFVKQLAEQRALEWENANPQKVKKGESFDKSKITEADLTPEMKAILNFYDQLAVKEKELAQANATKELLSQYQTYMQKRNEVAEKYERDRKAMKNADGTYKKGFSKENEDILNKQEQDALSAVDVEFAMKEEQFEIWANEVANLSLKQLEKLLAKAQAELQDMEYQIEEGEGAGISDKELGKKRAAVKTLQDAVKKAKVSPEKRAEQDWKELYQTLNDISEQFEEIGSLVGGTAGEITALAGTTAAGVLSMIDGIKAVAKTGAESLSAVEKASVILGIISTAIKIVTKIINLANEMHDKKHEQRIEKLQDKVDNLEKSYEKLGDAIEEAYSKSAAKMYEELNKILEQQKAAIEQMQKEEEEKKKTDEDKIKDYQDRIDEINKKLEENAKKAKDAIYGETVQQAIENLGEAYAEALSKGEDGWVSLKDTAKEMMKKMVVQTIKETLKTTKAIESIREKLREFYLDNILTSEEQEYIYKMANDVQRMLDREFGWADSLFKEDTSTEQKATYGGFETMSEDTGSELNGRFTALQMAGEEIKREAINQTIALNEIKGSLNAYFASSGGAEVKTSLDNMLNFVSQSYMELQDINQNTSENVKLLKTVETHIKRWDAKIMGL